MESSPHSSQQSNPHSKKFFLRVPNMDAILKAIRAATGQLSFFGPDGVGGGSTPGKPAPSQSPKPAAPPVPGALPKKKLSKIGGAIGSLFDQPAPTSNTPSAANAPQSTPTPHGSHLPHGAHLPSGPHLPKVPKLPELPHTPVKNERGTYHYEERQGHAVRVPGQRPEEIKAPEGKSQPSQSQPSLFDMLAHVGDTLSENLSEKKSAPGAESGTVGTAGATMSAAGSGTGEESSGESHERNNDFGTDPHRPQLDLFGDPGRGSGAPDRAGSRPQGSRSAGAGPAGRDAGVLQHPGEPGHLADGRDEPRSQQLSPVEQPDVEQSAVEQSPDPARPLEPDAVVEAHRARGLAAESFDPTTNAQDFRLTDELRIGEGGLAQKANDNLAAIALLKKLEAENRSASDPEKAVLARYTGWGAFGQAFQDKFKFTARYDTYEDIPSYFKGAWSQADKKHWELFKKLSDELEPEELEAAHRSTLNAHYTSEPVVKAMWDAARHLGLRPDGPSNQPFFRVLEPALGSGNFFGFEPEDLIHVSRRTGVELDTLTGRIAQNLYPGALVHVKGFQDAQLPDDCYDLAISNVPFGDYKVFDPAFADSGRSWLSKAGIHNYFFAKALDKIRPGGVTAFVTSTGTLDSAGNQKVREYLSEKADFLGAVRLPNDAFDGNAGTSVTTDIIFLRKKDPIADAEFESLHPRDAQGRFIHKWTQSKPMVVKDEDGNDHTINVNEYFHDHPEMMLGEMGVGSGFGLYSATSSGMKKRDGQDTGEALAKALSQLPADALTPPSNEMGVREKESAKYAADYHKPNSFVVEDGQVYYNRAGVLEERSFASRDEKGRVMGLAHLRDVAHDLIHAEVNDLPPEEIEELRRQLNRSYDEFKARYGDLHKKANVAAFAEDDDAGLLLALEDEVENRGVLARGKNKTSFKKADIFSKRTQQPLMRAKSAASPEDALNIVLNESGRLDWERLSELLGQSAEEVRDALAARGLIFRDPDKAHEADQGWVTAAEYLSGNVRQKLATAKEWAVRPSAHSIASIEANIAALEAVQPQDIPPDYAGNGSGICATLGATWIPPQVIDGFIDHLLGSDGKPYNDKPLVQYVESLDSWKIGDVGYRRLESVANMREWGTPDVPAHELVQLALNQKDPKVTRQERVGGKVERVPDPDATTAALEKQSKIKDEFRKWVWSDPERAVALSSLYNERYNNERLREYDGSHLTLPGMREEHARNIFPHIKNAIYRAVNEGVALFDHVVGAGKTRCCVATGMELRRLGLAKKPMIIVPNQNIPQWSRDIKELYPHAKVLVVWKKDWSPEKRREMTNKIATGDWDLVVMTHSAFNMIPCSKETYQQFYSEEINKLGDALEDLGFGRDVEASDLRPGRGEKADETRTAKQIAKQRENLEAKLEEKLHRIEKQQDKSLNWEDLGVDSLLCDEWDMSYKNLGVATKMESVSGLSRADSDRAFGFYIKGQHLLRKNNNRGLYLATATPISNTMAEMFNIKRTLLGKHLKDIGLDTFDRWKGMFGETETTLEAAPEGGYRPRKRFAKFINVPEMIKLYRKVADVKTYADLPELVEKLPEIEGGQPTVNVAKPSRYLKAFMKHIQERAADISGKNGKANIPDPKDDNFLKLTVDARKASLDLQMVIPEAPDDPRSKVNACVHNVVQAYNKSNDYKGTQLIFLDLSTPKASETEASAKAKAKAKADDAEDETPPIVDDESPEELEANKSVYQKIKDRLIAQGVPENEIAFAHEFDTDAKRKERDRKMNAGEIRVLIGSTGKMGAGLNIQQRLYAMHHLDCPWRPRDLEQRDGRGYRQGNLHKEWGIPIQIHRYVTKGSFDEYMWQGIVKKLGFITQAKRGIDQGRTMEDLDAMVMDAAQIQAASSNNPLVRKKNELELRLRRVKSLKDSYDAGRFEMQSELASLPHRIADQEKQIAHHEAKSKTLEAANQRWEKGKPEKFSIDIGGKTYDNREEAGQALVNEYSKHVWDMSHKKSVPLARYGNGEHAFTVHGLLDPDPQYKGSFYASVYDPDGNHVGSFDAAASPGAHIQKLDNVMRSIGYKANESRQNAEKFKTDLADMHTRLPELKERVSQPFEHEQEYSDLSRQMQDVEDALEKADAAPEEGAAPGQGNSADHDGDEMEGGFTDYWDKHLVDGVRAESTPGEGPAHESTPGESESITKAVRARFPATGGALLLPVSPDALRSAVEEIRSFSRF